MKKTALLILILFSLAGFTVACGPGEEEENQENQIGDGETGDGETGDGETGDGETGDGETGDGETGDGETGDGETGDGETGDGEVETNTIVDIAVGNADFSLLAAAVVQAGLAETLSGEGPFTVFAPTDAAIQALLDTLGVELADIDNDELGDILTYHVLGAEVRAADVSFGAVTTVNGALALIAADGDGITYAGANITATDIIADNGVIHVIDQVVLPPGNAAEVATEANYSSLVAAAVHANLDGALAAGGPFTIFAPDNDAFGRLLDALGETNIEDVDAGLVSNVLLYHVLDGVVTSYDVAAGAVTPLNGDLALINEEEDGTLTFAGATITGTDVIASNAVIHFISDVVLPPGNAVEVATDEGFTSLVAAAVHAGLADTLTDGGPFTIFAPTEEAFANLLTALGVSDVTEVDATLVANVLLYHVLPGVVTSYDVEVGDVTTVNGASATIAVDGDALTYSGATIIATDVISSNAVIHVIDEVVLPPAD